MNLPLINNFSDLPHRVIILEHEDISDQLLEEILESESKPVAIDTEASGLVLNRDYLCVVQLAFNNKYIVITVERNLSHAANKKKYKNLCKILTSADVVKIFHYGRFDIAMMYTYFGELCQNVFCTKIASRLVRTYTEKHGLQALVKEMLNKQMLKEYQCSDWASGCLTEAQIDYAVADVKHLESLYYLLMERLIREERMEVATKAFEFLPYMSLLDVMGWSEDIFSHSVKRY